VVRCHAHLLGERRKDSLLYSRIEAVRKERFKAEKKNDIIPATISYPKTLAIRVISPISILSVKCAPDSPDAWTVLYG
jgi:hypothetical protein